jgi:hypothetical protein
MQVLSTEQIASVSGGLFFPIFRGTIDNLEWQVLDMVEDFASHAGDQADLDKYEGLYAELFWRFLND